MAPPAGVSGRQPICGAWSVDVQLGIRCLTPNHSQLDSVKCQRIRFKKTHKAQSLLHATYGKPRHQRQEPVTVHCRCRWVYSLTVQPPSITCRRPNRWPLPLADLCLTLTDPSWTVSGKSQCATSPMDIVKTISGVYRTQPWNLCCRLLGIKTEKLR